MFVCFNGSCLSLGAFNPVLEDPLPGQLKKQLVLRIISGQQLPKPKDSMLGDRGEVTASSFSFFLTPLVISYRRNLPNFSTVNIANRNGFDTLSHVLRSQDTVTQEMMNVH